MIMMMRMRRVTTKAAEHENAIPRWADRSFLMMMVMMMMMMVMMAMMKSETLKVTTTKKITCQWPWHRPGKG